MNKEDNQSKPSEKDNPQAEAHSPRYYATIAMLKEQKANEDKAIASFLNEKAPAFKAAQKKVLTADDARLLKLRFDSALKVLLGSQPCLTKMAKPKFPLLGREKELSLLKEALLKERMRNVIITGLPGLGKTALIEEAAARDPENVYLQFNIAASVAGTELRGQFEGRINSVFSRISTINSEFKDVSQVILFVDEIHMMYRAGAVEGGSMDMANIIKAYLTNPSISLIGATTDEEYARTIGTDGALERRFTHLRLRPLDPDSILHILQNFARNRLSKTTLVHLFLASRRLTGFDPDRSLEVLDLVIAKAKFSGVEPNDALVDEVVDQLQGVSTQEGACHD